MDLDQETGQNVLDESIQGGKQRYGYYDGKIYEFQPDNVGSYHGYPIPGNEAPPNVLREFKRNETITNSQYNKFRKRKINEPN